MTGSRDGLPLALLGASGLLAVRAALPGSGPAVGSPLLLVPVVVATVAWAAAARGGERPRTPTSGSGVVPR